MVKINMECKNYPVATPNSFGGARCICEKCVSKSRSNNGEPKVKRWQESLSFFEGKGLDVVPHQSGLLIAGRFIFSPKSFRWRCLDFGQWFSSNGHKDFYETCLLGGIMTNFMIKIKLKGWTPKEVGERWGIKQRQMNNISRNPKVIHFDAVEGLPTKLKST